MPAPAQSRPVLRMRAGELAHVDDMLVDEVPIALVYNGISHAVMMATPTHLDEFALGFSLSEGIIAAPGQCYGIDVERDAAGIAVQIDIATSAFVALKERRRSLAGRTGCGLCGVDSLDQVCRPWPPLTPAQGFQAAGVRRALAAIGAEQQLTRMTGAAHAAAWCGMDGTIHIVREDVGRHNALDKLIGAALKAKLDPAEAFVIVTSRCSYEMVEKTVLAGVSLLVAISAPTALAIRKAEGANLSLVALARRDGHAVFTGGHRVLEAEARPKAQGAAA